MLKKPPCWRSLTALLGVGVTLLCVLKYGYQRGHGQGYQTGVEVGIQSQVHRVYRDGLTKLANRVALVERLKSAPSGTFAMLVLDLDGFKPVNDQYGHREGDTLLVVIGQRLQETVSKAFPIDELTSTASPPGRRRTGEMRCPAHRTEEAIATGSGYRTGGDEFASVIGPFESQELAEPAALQLAEKIASAIAQPVGLENGEVVKVTASIGIACGTQVQKLLHMADIAMYNAKTGKNVGTREAWKIKVFRPGMTMPGSDRDIRLRDR